MVNSEYPCFQGAILRKEIEMIIKIIATMKKINENTDLYERVFTSYYFEYVLM